MDLDLSYLSDITGGDQEMMVEMLDLFVSDIPMHCQQVQAFAEANELDDMAKEAHKVKPSLQYAGLHDMFELIKKIEEIGKGNAPADNIEAMVNELNRKAQEAIPALVAKKEEISNP